MQRYFLNETYNGQNSVILSDDDYHHIIHVMRMKEGATFWVVFSNSKTALVSLESINDTTIKAKIMDWEKDDKELPVHVTIASGLPKGDKLEWIVQKGTELGATEFTPFIAERSIVKWEKKKAEKKVQRWKKIAKEAAEQSHRQLLPIVQSPVNLKEIVTYSQSFEWKILAFEEAAKEGEKSQFAHILSEMKQGDRILIVFGPEGGITDQEKDFLVQNDFKLCGLGPRILRTETAPLYTLAAISYHFELLR
ncbi:16S rRNA (uracil(1498)-N(3))-methyltransferase [Lederbergia galactosidilytica]|uniref:Ribosomal RNA small subunit methyltransferase E n=1 Tax=Lederbergia galactosidilytica TaxID=217031 RepID=A0A178A3E0_9BACI|nr:16S rRNA (uracil(1498)-N(3))-methyltransferase [Lederbergia galactosidilytica]KRG15541.1 16S rRNA methyltransferase [Virgibacillus soli]MBP1914830.1 16S rRNA (uracil1498-N3)-methyltransferase [Lederbergia galactosidilytica]OAK74725.1 16S rRNA methyltransferase [Lederbergia galactosidilytica]